MHKLPFSRVHEAYERGHIAVVPTRQGEGTSLACLEAFAFGLPVIATWVGGLPNLVQDGLNGRLVPPTISGVTSALRDLLQNPHVCAQLRQGALATADRFSRARWEQRVRELLKRLGWISCLN
jgi:glycosyltransferase involved in cell wall biosynthesis